MERFVARYRPLVTSILSGFDRLVFRGSLVPLIRPRGMHCFLRLAGKRLLDYRPFVLDVSERLKEAALRSCRELGRPIRYLESSKIDKEDLARRLLDEHPIDEGPICALTTVEPCRSFEYHRSKDPHERGLKLRLTKCLHIYQYHRHPVFGFLNARIQTWFPFNVQICLNGREWLARRMERLGLRFRRHDNCFTWLKEPERAQRLMDEQLQLDWKRALTAIARLLNPLHSHIFKPWPMDYYWTAYQSEWATDLCFKDQASLARIYPALTKHAMLHFQSPDVMRFLGRKVHGRFLGELMTSFKNRPEGVRVKHWAAGNSIKMYDKYGRLLRIETTIAKTQCFKVFRPLTANPEGKRAWRPLRKGIADLHRRAQVSQAANERYLDALADVDDDTTLAEIFDQVAKPTTWRGRRVRAIHIGAKEDIELLEVVVRGEFATNGFRNRDLRRRLEPASLDASKSEQRRASARLSRRLRMLRAHGLIQKVPRTHLYRLTRRGQLLAAALHAARSSSIKQLLGSAA
jgi:DNA-binding HxlR family transcriptional regulator